MGKREEVKGGGEMANGWTKRVWRGRGKRGPSQLKFLPNIIFDYPVISPKHWHHFARHGVNLFLERNNKNVILDIAATLTASTHDS